MIAWWTAHWPDIKDLFNSVFFISIVGAAGGAYAGAYAAQRIAERTRYREQLLKEIRDTNAAISLAFGICNSLLGVKKQHIKALKETFEAQKTALLDHKQKMASGQIPRGTEFQLNADLETLSLPALAVDILQKQIFEKLSVVGRPLNLATTIVQTVHGLSASLEKRNELIASYKAGNPPFSAELYFGLPRAGTINQDYPSVVDAMYSQTDDGIFFTQFLCQDLNTHGNQLAATFTKQFGKGVPTIGEPDFGKAETAGLMPNANNYSDWVSAFHKKEVAKKPATFIRRLLARINLGV